MTDKKTVPAELRRSVRNRARCLCEYCRTPEDFSPQSFVVEHIFPRVLGGETKEENLAYSCQGCNSHKAVKTGAIDPVTEENISLFNPRTQIWREHFVWNENFTEVIGLTATGRATVEALHLNRNGLKNLRRVLYRTGQHPPMEF